MKSGAIVMATLKKGNPGDIPGLLYRVDYLSAFLAFFFLVFLAGFSAAAFVPSFFGAAASSFLAGAAGEAGACAKAVTEAAAKIAAIKVLNNLLISFFLSGWFKKADTRSCQRP